MRCSSAISRVIVVLLIQSSLVFSATKTNPCPTNATYVLTGKVTDPANLPIPNAMVSVTQGSTEHKVTTNGAGGDQKGTFRIECLSSDPFKITYSADGFGTITEVNLQIDKNTQWPPKALPRESVGGIWLLLLFLPAVLGLLVPLISPLIAMQLRRFALWVKKNAMIHETEGSDATVGEHEMFVRLTVALINGFIWAMVLLVIWCFVIIEHNVYKIQLFSPDLTFEFYVPLLGFFGALLYVFDVFRARDDDRFKGKEFGMRIVMAPYVAIIVVALFGKNFDFMDLTSQTSQASLAFVSGLVVVAFLQGIIERTNEFLDKWRKRQVDYKPSPLSTKFDLSEEEDLNFRSVGIRLPDQLLSREESELKEAGKNKPFDTQLALALKKRLEYERFEKRIGEVVWGRLAADGVRSVDAFSDLQDDALKKVADIEPKLEVTALQKLRDSARKLTQV